MGMIIGRGRYRTETYPQGSNGGASANLLSLPWTSVAAGATFQPTASQPWLAVDTSGGAQATIEMPANPYDGMPLVVTDDDGNAAVNPILFTVVGGKTISDPQSPGTYAATVAFATAGGTVAWKYRAATQQWVRWALS